MHVTVMLEVGAYVLHGREIEALTVDHAIGEHARCWIELHRNPGSESAALTHLRADDVVAAPVRVVLCSDGVKTVVFTGEVVRVREEHLPHGASHFFLDAISASRRWDAYHQMRGYRNHTVADVAKTLGVSIAGDVPAADRPLNYVQYGESDWDFVRRLASENGLLLRATDQGAELLHGFATTVHHLTWGVNLMALRSEADATNHGVKGALFESTTKHDHRFHGVRRKPEWLGGAAELVNAVERGARCAEGGGDPCVVESAARAPTLAEYRRRLERESERRLGGSVRVAGRSIAPSLRLGNLVEIASGDAWELEPVGALGLVAVTHQWDGQLYENSFVATPWAGYSAPPLAQAGLGALQGAIPGATVALVVENADPGGMGRVRLRYPWQGTEEKTGWVRVATPYAGNGRGVGFLPEIGDEVLVAFEQGDVERPFVIGSLWNGVDVPVHTPDVKQLTTRSGNTLRLVDAEGAEMVELFSAAGKCLIQLRNAADGTPTVTIHSEGDLSLEAPNGQIRLVCKEYLAHIDGDAARDVKGSVTEKVGASVTVDSGGSLTYASGASVAITARASLTAHAGGTHTVSGSLVQLNPPGAASPPVSATVPAHPASYWATQVVPTVGVGQSTSDAPTPRKDTG